MSLTVLFFFPLKRPITIFFFFLYIYNLFFFFFPDTLYPGANTTLTLSEYVLQPIDCDFDLSFYPFDVHECILPLVLVPHGAKHARLVIGPSSARYTGQVGLKDFSMDKVKVESRDATVRESIRVNRIFYFFFC